jgi:hypothetical protein
MKNFLESKMIFYTMESKVKKNKIGVLIISLFILQSTVCFSKTEREEPKPPGVVESPYEACREVVIAEKETYEKNASLWKAWEAKCNKKAQLAEDAGLTRVGSLSSTSEYLDLAYSVVQKVVDNLEKSQKYAQCSKLCFSGATKCDPSLSENKQEVICSKRKEEITSRLKQKSREARLNLALSREDSSLRRINIYNADDFKLNNEDARVNKKLQSFETAMPNPVGGAPLDSKELDYAKRNIRSERLKAEAEFKDLEASSKRKLRRETFLKLYMDKIDKRKEEKRQKYLQIIYEESPILAVIEKASKFDGDTPVWSDAQMAQAFGKLNDNAEKTKLAAIDSLKSGKLEFSRLTGEAMSKWLMQLAPGTKDKNDLLYYIGMKNQVEQVLKEKPHLCAAATSMSNRLNSKELQNTGIIFASSFLAGPVAKSASNTITSIFRFGRALTAAEANGLTGLALGSTFLGDSFRAYNTSVAEATSGVRPVEAIENARTGVVFNLVFAPIMAPAGWHLGKTLYSSLGKKMAKDSPELATLMKNAGTNQALQDQVVDKWIIARVKNALKTKFLGVEDKALLESADGKKILNTLAEDISKNNPKFFNDPINFDLFLKTAATSIKKKPGDPNDLGEKSRHLFLSFGPDAFESWDPKARAGLMKVFDEGVEELRLTFSKDPATYAKFTTDNQAKEKIFLAALKRAGVVDDAEAAAMKTCALKI